MAVFAPIAVAAGPVEFITETGSAVAFATGLGLALGVDYVFVGLTDSGKTWPQMPAWATRKRLFRVQITLTAVYLLGVYVIFRLGGAPALAFGLMHALTIGGITATGLGGIRIAAWTVRQRI
jgi:hypothetical protein